MWLGSVVVRALTCGQLVTVRLLVTAVSGSDPGRSCPPYSSVIFVLTYFLVLVLVAVFEIFFSFSFVLVFVIFSF